MDIYNLTNEERADIIDALFDQATRLNEAAGNKKNDPAIRRNASTWANRIIVLANRLKRNDNFQFSSIGKPFPRPSKAAMSESEAQAKIIADTESLT